MTVVASVATLVPSRADLPQTNRVHRNERSWLAETGKIKGRSEGGSRSETLQIQHMDVTVGA